MVLPGAEFLALVEQGTPEGQLGVEPLLVKLEILLHFLARERQSFPLLGLLDDVESRGEAVSLWLVPNQDLWLRYQIFACAANRVFDEFSALVDLPFLVFFVGEFESGVSDAEHALHGALWVVVEVGGGLSVKDESAGGPGDSEWGWSVEELGGF